MDSDRFSIKKVSCLWVATVFLYKMFPVYEQRQFCYRKHVLSMNSDSFYIEKVSCLSIATVFLQKKCIVYRQRQFCQRKSLLSMDGDRFSIEKVSCLSIVTVFLWIESLIYGQRPLFSCILTMSLFLLKKSQRKQTQTKRLLLQKSALVLYRIIIVDFNSEKFSYLLTVALKKTISSTKIFGHIVPCIEIF